MNITSSTSLAALALVAGFGLGTAEAASPASGTISLSNTKLTFSGGPFVVPNQTDAAYDNAGSPNPVCESPGTDCDKFALTLDLPADFGTKNPNAAIIIKTSWGTITGNPSADACFADYLMNSNDKIVNAIYNCQDPAVIVQPAGQGKQQYTVEIIPEIPAGDSYTTTVELVTGGVTASTSASVALPANGVPPKPVAFIETVSPKAFGNDAGEPSLGVDWNPSDKTLVHDLVNTGGVAFFQSGPHTLRISFDDATSPATAKWDDVSTNLVFAAPLTDPIGFVDPTTGRVFSLDLIGGEGQSSMAFSDDDGASWLPSEGGPPGGSPDHETLGTGPYAAPFPNPGLIFATAVYYCGQAIAGENFCSRSDNGGLTFGPQIPTLKPTDCAPLGAQNGHVKVGPDGTVYLPQGRCPGLLGADVAAVTISTDNGLTWNFSSVPNSTSAILDPAVSIDAGNNVYLTWPDANHHPHVAVSRDHGATWSHDTDVGAPFGIANADFVMAAAGDAGRAAVGFIGTPTTGDSRSASAINTFRGTWHVYIAMTYDFGATWTTVDATPNDPVQVGSVCTAGTLCGPDRNLLDFNDLQVDKQGRVLSGFAKGCLAPSCNQNTAATRKPPYNSSRANKAAVLRQSCGLTLFKAYDDTVGATACPAGSSAKAAGGTDPAPLAGGALPASLLLPLVALAALRRRKVS